LGPDLIKLTIQKLPATANHCQLPTDNSNNDEHICIVQNKKRSDA